ncbi:MAG: NAD(P)/FAD-dependent oxidoreductase, partial [Christensenellaceae bacterium]
KNKENQVVILEESNVLGGISQTVKYNGNRMDIGGHRFFSKDDTIMNWWKDILPLQGAKSFDDKVLERDSQLFEGGPDPENSDEVMLVRKRVSRIYYKNHFFDYPVTMKFETIKNMGFITTVRAGFSYIWASIFKKKETSLENFYINRFGKVLYSMFFEDYTEKLWGIHPSEISPDWGAQRVKGLSIKAMIKDIFGKIFKRKNNKNVETSLIEEFWYPKFGPGQLWELVGKKFEENGGKILYGRKVESVVTEGDKIVKVGCRVDGKTEYFEADEFVSSMPIADFVKALDTAPQNIRNIAENLPYRDFVTVGLLVNKLKLVNKTKIRTLGDIVPDCWIYVQDKGVKLGRIQIFNNWSPYMVKDPENTVWIGLEYFCKEGDDFWNMSQEDTVKQGVAELIKIGVLSDDNILDSHRERVKKAYPAYFGTYGEFGEVQEYLNKFENAYFVGRNGQHRYNNMDHSMLTAINTAKIIENGGDKNEIWNVNTEKSYHESK